MKVLQSRKTHGLALGHAPPERVLGLDFLDQGKIRSQVWKCAKFVPRFCGCSGLSDWSATYFQ